MADEEHSIASPYLVVGADSRGWGIHCSCGWRIPLVESEQAALEAGLTHSREASQASERGGGLRGWWERRKRRYRGEERRHSR